MVDLKKISPAELYEALEQKDDGKTFVELVNAKAKMQEVLLSAQQKAGQKILDTIADFLIEESKWYKEEFGENWYEAMKKDKIWQAALEDDHLPDLIYNYMDLILE